MDKAASAGSQPEQPGGGAVSNAVMRTEEMQAATQARRPTGYSAKTICRQVRAQNRSERLHAEAETWSSCRAGGD